MLLGRKGFLSQWDKHVLNKLAPPHACGCVTSPPAACPAKSGGARQIIANTASKAIPAVLPISFQFDRIPPMRDSWAVAAVL